MAQLCSECFSRRWQNNKSVKTHQIDEQIVIMCGAATANRWSSRTMNADILYIFLQFLDFHQTREKMTFPWRESVRVESVWKFQATIITWFLKSNMMIAVRPRKFRNVIFIRCQVSKRNFANMSLWCYVVNKRGIQSISSRFNESESAIELLRFLESFYQWAIVNIIFFYFW